MPPDLKERIENDFAYHPVSNPGVGKTHDRIRAQLRLVALDLLDLTPASREQSLMLTALEEAMHWANAAVAKNQYTGPMFQEEV